MQCTCAILSSVACSALQYFSTVSHKRHDFREKKINIKIPVLIFSTTSASNISILRRNERDVIINVNWFTCKVPVLLVQF